MVAVPDAAVVVSRAIFDGLAEHAVYSARDWLSVGDPKLWAVVCSAEFQALLTPALHEVLGPHLPDIEVALAMSEAPVAVRREWYRALMGSLREVARAAEAPPVEVL